MKTYEEFVSSMVNAFNTRVGYSPDEASDIGIRIRVLAGELYNLQAYIEWVKRQVFVQTAQGEYLDRHAQLRGISRKPSAKSSGTVVFSLPENATAVVEIPQGTIVSTVGNSPVYFQTTEYGSINVGGRLAYIPAQALKGGTNGNVSADAIKVIVTMVSENLSVTNLGRFTMGADEESDETLRKRVINSFKYIENGTNKAYYAALAKTVSEVECVNVVPALDGTNVVSLYISGKEKMVSQAAVNKVKELISSQREVNVDIRVYAAEIRECMLSVRVRLEDGYKLSNVQSEMSEKITAFLEDYQVGQSVDMAALKDLFYHQPGILEYEIRENSTGLTALKNEKIAFSDLHLTEMT